MHIIAKPRRLLAAVVALTAAAGLAAAGGGTSLPVSGPIVHSAGATEIRTADALRLSSSGTALPERTSSGYTLLESSLVGQTPAGFTVWVDPKAQHHRVIASNASAAVRELRSMGTNVRWRGYGSPSSSEGVVRIREGAKGCGGDTSTVGMTWTYWMTLASGKRYATRADIYLCPRLFRMATWATKATVRHELGHAMGLGHTNYRYRGSLQLMNAVVRSGVVDYKAGDRRGLEKLADDTAWVKTQIPPVGKLDSSAWESNGTIQFTGWALLKYYPANAVTITLTDNGRVALSSDTPLLRRDVNRQLNPGTRTHGYQFSVPWTGGTHDFCVKARSARYPSATTTLACVTWRG